jgi:hypothetical protein
VADAVIEYVDTPAKVFVIILGLGTEVRKANLKIHQRSSLTPPKGPHQDDQRAPHLTVPQFLFNKNTSDSGLGSLCLDVRSPPAFEAIEVLCKGRICRTYVRTSDGDFEEYTLCLRR